MIIRKPWMMKTRDYNRVKYKAPPIIDEKSIIGGALYLPAKAAAGRILLHFQASITILSVVPGFKACVRRIRFAFIISLTVMPSNF